MKVIVLSLLLLAAGCMGFSTPKVSLPEGANSLGLLKYEATNSGIIPGTSAKIEGCITIKEGSSALLGAGYVTMKFDGCEVTYGTLGKDIPEE